MSRIKEKVSQLVPGQFPEFIRENYDTFTTFVEAYYQFLEQDQGALELVQNARSYNDIDTTTSDFVYYFLSNYIKDIPSNVLANKRMLVKKISDLYSAKGSDMSFKMLFRILYDTNVEVSHPYDNVLRPSDGTWEQRVSLRVQLSYGSVSDILDRFITYKKNGITYNEPIVRVKALNTPGLYEIFLKSTSSAPYTVGDKVYVSNTSTVIFDGIINPTTTGYSITYGGSGFKVGQIFQINTGGATEALVRIIRTSANGSIKLLKILNYGYGFTNDITINLFNNLQTVGQSEVISTYLQGFTEEFTMMSPDVAPNASRYFYSDYVADGYTGTRLAHVSTSQLNNTDDSFVSATVDPTVAVISFKMGAVAKYPGQYISTRGFLSEPEVRLQDVNQYQPFAYELQSELDISLFYDTVLKLVHPAGTKLFSNRTITTTANLLSNVSVITTSNVAIELNDSFLALDKATVKLFGDLGTDNAFTNDSITLTIKPVYNDNVSITETFNLSLQLQAFSDSTAPSDIVTLNTSLEAFNDNTTPTESLTLNVKKFIDNTDSNVSFTESVVGTLLNYTDSVGNSGYFANIYAGSTIISV